MGHYDERLPGSIGGITVYFEKVVTTAGRRTVLHEYYGRDLPSVEDMGKATYREKLSIFVLGPEYNRTREEIVDLLNAPGPWELVDPWYGIVDVHVDGSVDLTEGLMHEGMMRIGSLSLYQAGDPSPITISDATSLVPVLIGIALDELAANTTLSFEGVDLETDTPYPASLGVLNSIASALFGVAGMLAGVNGKISGTLGKINFIGNAFDELANEIAKLKAAPAQLMATLGALVGSVMGFVDEFRVEKRIGVEEPVFPLVESTSAALEEIASFGVEPEPEPEGPQRDIEVAAHKEIALQKKAAAVLHASGTITGLAFESASQSVGFAAQLAEVYADVLSDETLPAKTHAAITAARTATLKLMRERAAALPRIETVTTAVPMSAILLAHIVYGDSARAGEIARRNRSPDPGWIPAGSIEVLVDE